MNLLSSLQWLKYVLVVYFASSAEVHGFPALGLQAYQVSLRS